MKKKSSPSQGTIFASKYGKVNPNMVTHENEPFVQRKLAAAKELCKDMKLPPEFKTGK